MRKRERYENICKTKGNLKSENIVNNKKTKTNYRLKPFLETRAIFLK